MKHITIVDDALDLGRVLQTMLLTLDPTLRINVMPSAEEALMDARRQPLDLLVTDIRLPGMSGLDLVRKLRLRQPSLKAILITGVSDDRILRQARDLKTDAFLQKPLDFPQFLAAARACLELPAPAPVETTAPQMPHLPDLISGLRQSLSAQAVCLLDERGRVTAKSGSLARSDLEATWSPAIFAALSAGDKVSTLPGVESTATVQVYTGHETILVIAPVGAFALLVVMKKGISALRLALAVEESLAVQSELLKTLQAPMDMPAEAPPPAPLPAALEQPAGETAPAIPAPVEEQPFDETAAGEIDQLLSQAPQVLRAEDLEAFWDSAAESGGPANGSPDMLSYDQAARLGFAPSEPVD
jgi:CheY-like chemotaxis protein